MIPISLFWDSRKRSIGLKWNGFFSLGREKGKVFMKIFRFPISLSPKGIGPKPKKIHLPMRWVYLKRAFSFLKEWKLKEVKGTLSFPDPMVNGLLYGWMCAVQHGKVDRKIDVTVNFLGENWCRGEVVMSLKVLFRHFTKWMLPFIVEMRKGDKRKD